MSIDHVIFDFGGVLLRTHDWSYRHAWDERLGLPQGAVERLFFDSPSGRAAQEGSLTLEAHWAAIGRHFALTPAQLGQMRRDFWAGDRLDTELVALLRALRENNRVALISNYNDGLRAELEQVWKIANLFDEIVISAEFGVMKPDPRIYQHTLMLLGALPEQAVFIDDSHANVEGAVAVGLHAVHFQAGLDLWSALDEMGIYV